MALRAAPCQGSGRSSLKQGGRLEANPVGKTVQRHRPGAALAGRFERAVVDDVGGSPA